MLMLYHEHDPDPEMRPNPIGPEQREEIIAHMTARLLQIYRHYLSQRQSSIPASHIVTDRLPGDRQGRAQRSVPLWLRQEIQALPRRHDTTLAQLFTASGFRFGSRLP
jgi:hypothetical protein